MVSLEERSNYLASVETKPKLKAFYSLLHQRPTNVPSGNDVNETDFIYYEFITSLLELDKERFLKSYQTISKRQPTSDATSPFINDDFLIFSLVLGVKLFNIEKKWISGIISFRNRNPMAITLENILNENYSSTSNRLEIVVSFLLLYDPSKLSNDLLKNCYGSITTNYDLLEDQNDIVILCSLKAFDLIVELSNPTSGGEVVFLQRFEAKFLRRMKIISVIIYNVILLFVLFILVKILDHLPEETIGELNQYNLIIGIVGAGLIGSNFIQSLRKRFTKLFCSLLGYDIAQIESIRNRSL